MKFLKYVTQKIQSCIYFLFLFKRESLAPASELIGLAQFDSQEYYFIRRESDIYLVSRGLEKTYSEKISLPKILEKSSQDLKDLHAIQIDRNTYVLACTFLEKDKCKTVTLASHDGINFEIQTMVDGQDGSPAKLVKMQNGDVALLTSISGEICYCNINLVDDELQYHKTQLGPRGNSFDHAPLKVTGVKDLDEGIFVLYEASYEVEGYQTHRFGGALLAHDNLSHVHWRAFDDEVPFWENFISRKESMLHLETMGVYFKNQELEVIFLDAKGGEIYSVELHQPYTRKHVNIHKAHLRKHISNPILKPDPDHNWECHTVLNPAAIQLDDVTHLLYRAEGSAGLSVIGYGKSHNGVTFERFQDPAYVPRMDFEGVNVPEDVRKNGILGSFKSGYNHYPLVARGDTPEWHGTEDPRVTEMDGRLYMIYAAYNGYQMARPAITSIAKDDFLNQEWNWTTPQPMTDVPQHHGEGNKNVVLHPEKVNGKYMLYHRIWPHILIDYVDDLEFGQGKKYLKEMAKISARGDSWDSHKIAVAAPPLLIDEGWLLIYQGAGSQDRKYKVGAMILDRDDPSKVLYRSNQPIMEPTEWYENEYKFGVTYPCGAVIREGMLNVYYGGSDRYVCLGQAPLREFVERLKLDPCIDPALTKEANMKDLCI